MLTQHLVRDAWPEELDRRAAVHAALGDPARLAIVDELAASDRSPSELGQRLGMASNLVAHHLEVLEAVGLISRSASTGDGRRRYVRLLPGPWSALGVGAQRPRGAPLFVCTRNSARSQLAAALWSARTGGPASSAGTEPAPQVAPGAVAAAARAGLSLDTARPAVIGAVPADVQVVTVCDRAHEELDPGPDWWHWSIPDPVAGGTDGAFDEVVAELDRRIALVTAAPVPATACGTNAGGGR